MIMRNEILQKLNLWIERQCYYPGCDTKTLNARKAMWIGSFYAFVHCFLLTPPFIIFAPQLTLLIKYGLFFICFFPVVLFLIPRFPRHFLVIVYGQFLVFNLITFYFILLLGGIPTSAGLIFVGITSVLSSIPLQNVKISVSQFIIFALIVILSTILRPWLTVPDQMTPNLNALIYMLNTLSMSTFALFVVLDYIAREKKLDQLETDRISELNEVRTKLFTNITHEFRTPLTVIRGMAGLIEKQPEEWIKEGIEKIKNNSDILLNLVNQMLDIARIETGAMKVNMVQADINGYIAYVTGLFRSVAQIRKIRLNVEVPGGSLVMDFDPDKLLHILSNLLSNALKFTPERGSVVVSTCVDEKQQVFKISISDSGKGIEPQDLPHIFDRFYQVENGTYNSIGSGLGLALTKELTELLHGKVFVESQSGIGSMFTVQLPVTHNADVQEVANLGFNEEQFNQLIIIPAKEEPMAEQVISEAGALPLLLIVEDSADVSRYLTALLKNEFRIEKAENGKTGLEKATDLIPDIILSDVMMPEMDGIAMLDHIKNDIRTSHIPLVMLTAKADIDSRLEGLERGADAYLAKPFEEKELRLVLRNLLELQKKLHDRYALIENQSFSPLPEYKKEDAFMIKVREVLEENLEDDEFGIAQLCRELAVSRTQLYRKFKSISNITIADYFKTLRLHKAKMYLSSSGMNVTEAAFAAGFKSLSYFSREFLAAFGKNPNEYRRK
jgi:signal transduction histidine kinase/DNA-binding response OmpR family regulator